MKCLIIGSGPAGYTAAIYAGRAGLKPVLYTGANIGGQLMQTTTVENFPGYPEGVEAFQMMADMRQQAERFGAEIRESEITALTLDKPCRATDSDGRDIEADAVIIATGATAKYLGLDDEQRYAGMGVSACATCDGFFYRKKVTAVVGGGDTACEDALYLAALCKHVFLVVRKPFLRASTIMQQRVKDNPNITILFEHNVTGLYGDGGVQGMHLVQRKGESDERHYDEPIDGIFLAIGHSPRTHLVAEQIALDSEGYIRLDTPSQRVLTKDGTPLPNVFAAGDVCDPHYRQAVVAAATGCRAALDTVAYLHTTQTN